VAGMLEGRVVVITGAGRGIGASVARYVASHGARVVVNDLGSAVDGAGLDTTPALEVVEQIREAGGEATPNGDDVADYVGSASIVRQAIDTYGGFDVLVNAAGILRDRMIFNMTEAEWDAVIRVHLKGSFNMSHHAAVYWRGQRNSEAHYRLITFTSVAGLHGAPGQPNYASAKLGIVGLTYSCAHALRPYGVTANAISPGATTRMTETVPDARRMGPARSEQAQGEMSPDNVAPAVAYLASERSDWCSGQVLAAGGYAIGLYSRPEVVREVRVPGPWDLKQAATLIEHSFRPMVERAPALYD
jgi:NAD(P)-dependent dehydrogenase (short-subunit alcohol dehydrogenase family)